MTQNLTPTIVFDLDGTLVDSMRDLVPALNRTIARDGLAPIAMDDVGHIVGQGALAMIGRAFDLRGLTLDETRQKELLGIFLAEYEAHIADQTVWFDGVMDALDQLSAQGWQFAICTNKFEHLANRLVDALGGSEKFIELTGGDTFNVKKPHPDHILKTIELADGDPARSIMVGDSSNDIDAARAASIPSIAVSFGYSDRPVSQLNAHCVIDHFRELPEAILSLSIT